MSSPMDLDITIISAKHLKNVNWRDGVLVPSVVLSLTPSLRVSTRPDTSGSTRPVWNERFLLPLPLSPPPHSLSLKIFHDDDPDLLVGSVRVLLPDSADDRIQTLELLRPSGRPHGKIRVKLALILRPPPPISQHYPIPPPVSTSYNPAPIPPPGTQNYHSAPLGSDNYTYATAPAPSVLGPPPPPPVVQNYTSAPPVSDNYNSAPAFRIFPIGPPPHEQFSMVRPPRPTVQNYNFAPAGSDNYTSAPAPPPVCPSVLSHPPSPMVVQNFDSDHSGSDNYNSATAPAFGIFPIGPPPHEFNSYTSATAPPPPQQFSTTRPPVVQNYSFAPPVSNNSTSAIPPACPPVPGPPRPNQLNSIMRQMQNYNFTPQGSNNYNYAPVCVGIPGPGPHQQSMLRRPPQVHNYNFAPSGSDNYTSAPTPTCPPFPHPPPPQQDFSFTPPGSYNYNSAPACPPVSSPPPPQQHYNITPQGSNNYNSATAPANPLSPFSGSVPPQQTSCYKNSYFDDPYNGDKNNGLVGAMRGLALEEEIESDLESTIDYSEYSESYIGQQPSAPVDDSVVFDRNKMMMRGSEKVENNAGSKESNVGPHYDYSEYRGSYGYN